MGLLDAPAVRALGQTCGMMYGALLRLPWSSFVGEDGEAYVHTRSARCVRHVELL